MKIHGIIHGNTYSIGDKIWPRASINFFFSFYILMRGQS